MLSSMFSHEKLQVYSKALDFVSAAAAWTHTWDSKHAVVDQLDRAAQSILLNLADAARRRNAPGRLQILDYASGSTLECAACLDIARIKNLLTKLQCIEQKQRLCEITKMLIGLRKAWAESMVREEATAYNADASKPAAFLFNHERLQVYTHALAFMEWFVSQPGVKQLSDRLLRLIDGAGTCIALNIAEGNGRYAELDHRRFIHIAESAAVRAAVLLDLSVQRRIWTQDVVNAGKERLRRISILLSGF